MKTARRRPSARPAPSRELAALRVRLAQAEETLRAIRTGEVDAVVIAGAEGPQVFTLAGAEHAYRLLIEAMNEGALTLTADAVILYANQCFTSMVKCPLEQVMGDSLYRFLSAADQAALRRLLKRVTQSGAKMPMLLHAGDGSQLPVNISIYPLARHGSKSVTIGMVVTDRAEALRTEEQLRALTHRVVQAQEAERRRVALELHDHITQHLCAILVRCHTLSHELSPREGRAKAEARKLRDMLGQTVEAVERISRHLRPSVLDQLGLIAVLRDTSRAFAARTGVSLELNCGSLTARLSADTELAFYRILQEALKNVENHARSRHVMVSLKPQGAGMQLVIKDDGIGFIPDHPPARPKGKGGLGLLSMRERAAALGGAFEIKSAPGQGTTIQAQIPCGNGAQAHPRP